MAIGNVELTHECWPITPAHENSEIELRQSNRGSRQAETNWKWKKGQRAPKKSLDGLNIAEAYRPPGIATSWSSGWIT